MSKEWYADFRHVCSFNCCGKSFGKPALLFQISRPVQPLQRWSHLACTEYFYMTVIQPYPFERERSLHHVQQWQPSNQTQLLGIPGSFGLTEKLKLVNWSSWLQTGGWWKFVKIVLGIKSALTLWSQTQVTCCWHQWKHKMSQLLTVPFSIQGLFF